MDWENLLEEEKKRKKLRKVYRKGRFIVIKMPSGSVYDIPLDRCQTAGECLDWVHQVSVKTWASPIMQDFLEVLFENIDVNLWSGGGHHGV